MYGMLDWWSMAVVMLWPEAVTTLQSPSAGIHCLLRLQLYTCCYESPTCLYAILSTCPLPSAHTGVQDRIAAELDFLGLLAKPGQPAPRELQWEDLKCMPYLTACAKEAMRMLPVVSIMARIAGQDMHVGPYKVPKGTLVGTPLFAIHNTVHNWDQPEIFRPERWLDVPAETYVYNSQAPTATGSCQASSGSEKLQPGSNAAAAAAAHSSKKGITFMPFSEGPRNCVGQSLAKMEVMTLLAKLLANFRIELAPEMGGREGVQSRESTHLTLQTAGTKGIRCHLYPRTAAA